MINFENAPELSAQIISGTTSKLQPVTAANSTPKTTFKTNSSAAKGEGPQMDLTQLNKAVSAHYSLPGKMLGAALMGKAAATAQMAGAIQSYVGGGSGTGVSFDGSIR